MSNVRLEVNQTAHILVKLAFSAGNEVIYTKDTHPCVNNMGKMVERQIDVCFSTMTTKMDIGMNINFF